MLQEIIVNLQQESKITICICDHQARGLLACVHVAMLLNNGKIIAKDTPSNLVNSINAKNAYFGDSFKFNQLESNKNWIDHKDLRNGGVIDFEMTNTPNLDWGSAMNSVPFSMTKIK